VFTFFGIVKKHVLRVLLDPWFGDCNTMHYNSCVVVDGSRDVRCNKWPGFVARRWSRVGDRNLITLYNTTTVHNNTAIIVHSVIVSKPRIQQNSQDKFFNNSEEGEHSGS
jgi:hypothetical protein